MKTKLFLELLKQHQDKSLLFEYAPNMLIGANYHITEVKNVTVDAVDCGAGVDCWKETIIQLWESPSEIGKTTYMSTYKALAVLNKVGKIKPMEMDAEVKFEYGNAHFHKAHLNVKDVLIQEKQLLVKLLVSPTDCKAKEACGISVPSDQALPLNSCSPESGCC